MKPYIDRRAENPQGFSNHVRKAIGELLGMNIIDPVLEQEEAETQSIPRCKLCVDEACQTAGYKEKKYNRANKAHYVCNLCSNISVAPTAKRRSNLFVIIVTICYCQLNKDSDL